MEFAFVILVAFVSRVSFASILSIISSLFSCCVLIIFSRSIIHCVLGSGFRLSCCRSIWYCCLYTEYEPRDGEPGFTLYAEIRVISLFFRPWMVIQLHLPKGLSVPDDTFVPVHLFSIEVIVPPGNQVLCFAGIEETEYDEKLFG